MRDDEIETEAIRLAALPDDVRQQFLRAFRDAAADPELSEQDQERVAALERLLDQAEG